MNTFGKIFRLTSFGESHGEASGELLMVVLPDLNIDFGNPEGFTDANPGNQKSPLNGRRLTKLNFFPEYLKGKHKVRQLDSLSETRISIRLITTI